MAVMRSDFFVGQPMFIGWRAEEPPPSAPVITSTLARNGRVGVAFSYTITANGRPAPTFDATNLPPGLTFAGRVISGTPTTVVTGHNITLTATNTEGTDTKTLVVNITVAAAPPVISSSLTANAEVGVSFSYTITASNSPTSFNATNLPAGLTRMGAVISGTPTTAMTRNVPITATNADGSDTKTLVLTIAPAGTGVTPTPPWDVTFSFSNTIVNVNGLNIGGVNFPPNARIPLVEMAGWQASYAPDMSDDLYNATSQATLPVQLYAKYTTDAVEKQIPFDNWGPHTPPGGNAITEWGYASATNSIYIQGVNATGNPIALRLSKA